MSPDRAKRPARTVDRQIDRCTGFPVRYAEIDTPNVTNRQPGKDGVAVVPVAAEQRRARNGPVVQTGGEMLKQVESDFRLPLQFLERDEVGIEFPNDGQDSLRIVTSVSSDAVVNIVSCND